MLMIRNKSSSYIGLWFKYFDFKSEEHCLFDNTDDSKILVISRDQAISEREEYEFNKYWKKSGRKVKAEFHFRAYDSSNPGFDEIKHTINIFKITNIIFNYEFHGMTATLHKEQNALEPAYWIIGSEYPNSWINKFIQDGLINEVQKNLYRCDNKCAYLKLRNNFTIAGTIKKNIKVLQANVATTGSGWVSKIKQMLHDGEIKNDVKTRVVIISGTHGNKMGESGFTNDTCLQNEKEKMYEVDDEKWNSLKSDKFTDRMLANIMDMRNYHKQPDKLEEDINSIGPQVIILAYCFSDDGDVVKFLHARGILYRFIIYQKYQRYIIQKNIDVPISTLAENNNYVGYR